MRAKSPAQVTLAAYTHFGARGLKGVGMYYLVREAWRKGRLRKVVAVSKNHCQYDFDLDRVEVIPGESKIVNGLGKIKAKLWEGFPSRYLSEMIFDRFAASRLREKVDGELLVTVPRMNRTTEKAKKLGYTTVLYGDRPYPQEDVDLIRFELDRLGLNGKQSNLDRTWMMERFAAHLDSVDYIIAISDFTKETYVKHGFPSDRIFVAPLGVDLKRFPPALPPSDPHPTYLFLGHVDGSTGILKGLQYLLQAWSELNLEDAKLLVCGNMGSEGQAIIRQYEGRLKNVEFTGSVSNPWEYYRKASVFVFPSVAEGFGKVVLEAMACCRPVIATPVPSPIVRDGVDGFYVPPRDAQGLKDKILYFYHHPDQIGAMGVSARQRAEIFNWERFSQQVADILAELPVQQSA